MVGNHGFVDGNKRTAWICAEILIERSDYTLAVPDDEPIDDLVVDAASARFGYDALLLWFKDRLCRADCIARRAEKPRDGYTGSQGSTQIAEDLPEDQLSA